MNGGGPTSEKSYAFALKIIEVWKDLQYSKKEYVLSRQLLRSGTSIGANVEEASAGLSRADFAAKLGIASREARETRYWLRLLRDSRYLETTVAGSMLRDCEELIRLLSASVKSLQSSLNVNRRPRPRTRKSGHRQLNT